MLIFFLVFFFQVNGQWSQWKTWSTCRPSCNKIRTRECDNPPPKNRGNRCLGVDSQTRNCTGGMCRRKYIYIYSLYRFSLPSKPLNQQLECLHKFHFTGGFHSKQPRFQQGDNGTFFFFFIFCLNCKPTRISC